MALVATLVRDEPLARQLGGHLAGAHDLAWAASWHGFRRRLKERPVTAAVVDLEALAHLNAGPDTLQEVRAAYPELGMILVVRRTSDPVALFNLGRTGVSNLVFLALDQLDYGLPRAVARATERGATSRVTRALSPFLPRRELWTVRQAMDSVHRRWSADQFARAVGLSRPFLSEVFKHYGLPSVGHLLLWARLLHAGLWLPEPGRTGESVSRQLEYSSGPAFRRALKHYTGATPTQVIEGGGFDFVLARFMESCGFGTGPGRPLLTVA